MKPVSPVLPDKDAVEATMTKDGHLDLPVIMDSQGAATSRWIGTPEEIAQIASQGYFYVRQLNAVNGVQPIQISADPPIVVDGESILDDAVLNADEISG